MRDFLHSIYRGIEQLVLPESCIGCGEGASALCVICSEKLSIRPMLLGGEEFRLAASLTYDELSAKIVLAAKEEGSRSARGLISSAIAAAALVAINDERINRSRAMKLLWVPTSNRARRRRGGDFLAPIAFEVAKIINSQSDIQLIPDQLLRVRRDVVDQSRLSAIDRDRNLHGAFTITQRWRGSGQVILIDDVVTTGSTLREAVRALRERNLTVIAAATACASRLRKPIR